MFQFWLTPVVLVVKPVKPLMGPEVSVTRLLVEGAMPQPTPNAPVKRAHRAWTILCPAWYRGGSSILSYMFTTWEVTAALIPVRTQVPAALPVARPAWMKWSAAAQKSGVPSPGVHVKLGTE